MQTLNNLRDAMGKIDQKMVEKWVRDLVIVKTFAGLRFQEAILKKGAEIKKTDCRLSKPEEESQMIDGFIGNVPVSIKPRTYESKGLLPEHINVKIVYYEKIDDGIEVDFGEALK